MTEPVSPTLFWTVEQWADFQRSNSPEKVIENLVDLVRNVDAKDAWIALASEPQLREQWREFTANFDPNKNYPLYGVPFAVKDNIDVKEFATTAACPAYEYYPNSDATVVKLLKQSGAVVIGKTNLDQFATGLVGTRSPYGRPSSVFSKNHISGGSSSGSAIVVALGIVPFALGTDTAGSGRIPAQFNNIIGVKPTRGLISSKGVVPACKTLDCVSIFATILQDAEVLLKICAVHDPDDAFSRTTPKTFPALSPQTPKIAVPDAPKWFGDQLNPKLWTQTLDDLNKLNIQIVAKDFGLFYQLADCLYNGPWVAERYTVIKDLVHSSEMNLDVQKIVKTAEKYTAVDCFEFEYLRREILRKIELEFEGFDGFLVPTAPFHPSFDEVEREPIEVNTRLGTYTNFVNLADFCALAIPGGFRADDLPFGVTLISWKFRDYALMELAMRFLTGEGQVGRRIGASQFKTNEMSDRIFGRVTHFPRFPVVVVGAHLRGMRLNHQLTDLGAVFVRETRTAANYRLYALDAKGQNVLKPGLRRVSKSGARITVEIWNLPVENVGQFVAQIAPPLGIGSIELEDRTWLKGFVCEDIAFDSAQDITEFGGWKSFLMTKF